LKLGRSFRILQMTMLLSKELKGGKVLVLTTVQEVLGIRRC
jgi:hypothetical protein